MDAQEITIALGGKWHGSKGWVRCPCHDDNNPSCCVSNSPNGLRVACLAGCSWQAIKDTWKREGLLDGDWKPDPERIERQQAEAKRKREKRERLSQKWFREAGPVDGPVLRYLREQRGYQGEIPWTLRAHPGLMLNGRIYPALLAAYAQWPGKTVRGVVRVFVTPDGRKVERMDAGTKGCVRLCPAGPVLALTEGVEDGLSLLATGMPAWAVGSVSGLYTAALPMETREVVIAADNDGPGREAATKAVTHWRQTGRTARCIWPPEPFNDWNDALKAGALGAINV